MIHELHKRVVRKWQAHAPESWWGDFTDIRFFLLEKLSSLAGQKILDVGCNAGVIASELEAGGNTVVGLDADFKAIRSYQRLFDEMNLRARVVCGNWNPLMFMKESFDVLVLSWVLYCDADNKNKIITIKGLNRLLKPGGRLYFIEANRICPIQGRGENSLWTIDEAREIIGSNGFEVKELLGWNPLPSLFFWLPLSVKMRLPKKLLLSLYPPGRLVQYLPGWYPLFCFLGKYRCLWKYCRTYYLSATKV